MSKLYASLDPDNRTTVTRRGHRAISAHVRGWREGVKVYVCIEGDAVRVNVWRTGGSSPSRADELVASWTEGNPEPEIAQPFRRHIEADAASLEA